MIPLFYSAENCSITYPLQSKDGSWRGFGGGWTKEKAQVNIVLRDDTEVLNFRRYITDVIDKGRGKFILQIPHYGKNIENKILVCRLSNPDIKIDKVYVHSVSDFTIDILESYTLQALIDNVGNVLITSSGEVISNKDELSAEKLYNKSLSKLAGLDSEAPVIEIVGNTIETLIAGDNYIDSGATATDNRDGDITSKIVTTSNVDTTTEGEYYVTYNVKDGAGNSAIQMTRAVNVLADTAAPIFLKTEPLVFSGGKVYLKNSSPSGSIYDAELVYTGDGTELAGASWTPTAQEYPQDGTIDFKENGDGKGSKEARTNWIPTGEYVQDFVYDVVFGTSYKLARVHDKGNGFADIYLGDNNTTIALSETNKPYTTPLTPWVLGVNLPDIVNVTSVPDAPIGYESLVDTNSLDLAFIRANFVEILPKVFELRHNQTAGSAYGYIRLSQTGGSGDLIRNLNDGETLEIHTRFKTSDVSIGYVSSSDANIPATHPDTNDVWQDFVFNVTVDTPISDSAFMAFYLASGTLPDVTLTIDLNYFEVYAVSQTVDVFSSFNATLWQTSADGVIIYSAVGNTFNFAVTTPGTNVFRPSIKINLNKNTINAGNYQIRFDAVINSGQARIYAFLFTGGATQTIAQYVVSGANTINITADASINELLMYIDGTKVGDINVTNFIIEEL